MRFLGPGFPSVLSEGWGVPILRPRAGRGHRWRGHRFDQRSAHPTTSCEPGTPPAPDALAGLWRDSQFSCARARGGMKQERGRVRRERPNGRLSPRGREEVSVSALADASPGEHDRSSWVKVNGGAEKYDTYNCSSGSNWMGSRREPASRSHRSARPPRRGGR